MNMDELGGQGWGSSAPHPVFTPQQSLGNQLTQPSDTDRIVAAIEKLTEAVLAQGRPISEPIPEMGFSQRPGADLVRITENTWKWLLPSEGERCSHGARTGVYAKCPQCEGNQGDSCPNCGDSPLQTTLGQPRSCNVCGWVEPAVVVLEQSLNSTVKNVMVDGMGHTHSMCAHDHCFECDGPRCAQCDEAIQESMAARFANAERDRQQLIRDEAELLKPCEPDIPESAWDGTPADGERWAWSTGRQWWLLVVHGETLWSFVPGQEWESEPLNGRNPLAAGWTRVPL